MVPNWFPACFQNIRCLKLARHSPSLLHLGHYRMSTTPMCVLFLCNLVLKYFARFCFVQILSILQNARSCYCIFWKDWGKRSTLFISGEFLICMISKKLPEFNQIFKRMSLRFSSPNMAPAWPFPICYLFSILSNLSITDCFVVFAKSRIRRNRLLGLIRKSDVLSRTDTLKLPITCAGSVEKKTIHLCQLFHILYYVTVLKMAVLIVNQSFQLKFLDELTVRKSLHHKQIWSTFKTTLILVCFSCSFYPSNRISIVEEHNRRSIIATWKENHYWQLFQQFELMIMKGN